VFLLCVLWGVNNGNYGDNPCHGRHGYVIVVAYPIFVGKLAVDLFVNTRIIYGYGS
jgi:hypothetical protein